MNNHRPIVVIGSINMDLVCRTPAIPQPGQTILGTELMTIPGGKGANQAVAAARLGATVHMIGRVGDDDMGQRLLNGLEQHDVKTAHVTVTEGTPSGCAMILVDPQGENAIVVAPGANGRLRPADIDDAREIISSAAAVIMQLEVPLETVVHATRLCRELGVPTILDPAPAPPQGLPRELYPVDLFTPNQGEAELLLGLESSDKVSRKRAEDPKQLGTGLLQRGARTVVLKMGQNGAMIVSANGQIETVRPFKAKVVDTTAAGDAFTAALAVGTAEGMPLPQAAQFAACAGAICCERFGAQPSLPDRAEVDHRLKKSTGRRG